MKTELWMETPVTSNLADRPERTGLADAEKIIESLRRVRIRTMLVQSLCKSLETEKH